MIESKFVDTHPAVSVIMPTFNYGKYIGEAIDSVLNQTFKNWELLIIDDCSTDGTYEKLCCKYKNIPQIRILKTKKNGGSAAARNLGLDNAKGKYIAFLDSDDFYDPTYLDEQISILESSQTNIIAASYRRLAKNSTTNFIVPKTITFSLALKGNPMAPLGTVYRFAQYKDLRFSMSMKKREDYVFFLNILKNEPFAIGNQKVLGTLRIHQGSKTKKKYYLIRWQYRAYRTVGLSIVKSVFYVLCWAFYGLKKYKNVR